MRKEAEGKEEGSGCLVALAGPVLTPALAGIPLLVPGLHLTTKREGFWRCAKCQSRFPRKIPWYSFS